MIVLAWRGSYELAGAHPTMSTPQGRTLVVGAREAGVDLEPAVDLLRREGDVVLLVHTQGVELDDLLEFADSVTTA